MQSRRFWSRLCRHLHQECTMARLADATLLQTVCLACSYHRSCQGGAPRLLACLLTRHKFACIPPVCMHAFSRSILTLSLNHRFPLFFHAYIQYLQKTHLSPSWWFSFDLHRLGSQQAMCMLSPVCNIWYNSWYCLWPRTISVAHRQNSVPKQGRLMHTWFRSEAETQVGAIVILCQLQQSLSQATC